MDTVLDKMIQDIKEYNQSKNADTFVPIDGIDIISDIVGEDSYIVRYNLVKNNNGIYIEVILDNGATKYFETYYPVPLKAVPDDIGVERIHMHFIPRS